MNTKIILSFIGGLLVGGAAGVLGTKKFLEDKYQKQYDRDRRDLEEYYSRTDEYARYCEADDDTYEDDQNDVNPTEDVSPTGGRMSSEERAKIKEKLNKNWEQTTNYAAIYKVKSEPSVKEVGFEGDTGEVPDENLDDVKDEQDFEEHQKNIRKPPKIISQKAYEDLDASVDHEILYLYKDGVLTEENYEPVDNHYYFIGDALTKYDFINSDEDIIFVMNYELNTCYEVQKVNETYCLNFEESE